MTIEKLRQAIDNNDADLVRATLIEHPEYLARKLSWNNDAYTGYVLAYAAVKKMTGIMQMLVTEFDVKLDHQDGNFKRWTALHYATYFGIPASVDTLLSLGASVSLKDENGETPLDICNHTDVQKKLVTAITEAWKKKKEPEEKQMPEIPEDAVLDKLQSKPILDGKPFKAHRPPTP